MKILGTKYEIVRKKREDDPKLVENDGYCDPTSKIIVIVDGYTPDINNVSDLSVYDNNVLRHEIIHAFLHESGLRNYSADETLVDWLAVQFPKCSLRLKMQNVQGKGYGYLQYEPL